MSELGIPLPRLCPLSSPFSLASRLFEFQSNYEETTFAITSLISLHVESAEKGYGGEGRAGRRRKWHGTFVAVINTPDKKGRKPGSRPSSA